MSRRLLQRNSREGKKSLRENGKVFKGCLIGGGIVVVSLLQHLTQRQEKYYHLFYRELYFLPLIAAGIWFGLRGAILSSLGITLSYLPIIWREWQGFSSGDFDRILQIIILNILAMILGLISDREKASLNALQKSETLADLGGAVSGILHDMKTPLIAIGGYARSIKKNLSETDPNQKKLDTIVKEVERLDNLTRDILFYARPVPEKPPPRDLNELVRGCCPLAKEAARKRNIRMEISLSPSLPSVSVDKPALERTLLNLLLNAIEASPDGGLVTVKTEMKGREAVISIGDEGPGIPVELRKQIFFPFFTTKKEGTGLGLSIAFKIVKTHGGHITVRDNGRTGTIFEIHLPLKR
jgi:two-component system, NtrC family, sensor histidine kinase HydH